jgi:hypothetical protein
MLQVYISNVSDVFRGMLELFHADVAKTDQYVANSCPCMLQTFVLDISSVFSNVCCKYVYLDGAYVLHNCCKCFRKHISSVSSVFGRMLQMLHLDIDRVLHMRMRV